MAEEHANIYFPYDEITTVLIPAAEGCPYNQCTFCSMYQGCEYREVPLADVEQVLLNVDPCTERVFLTGADPLYLGFDRMMRILKLIQKYLPYCACVASYASVRSVARYTEEQLLELHEAGLRLLYIGFETGDDVVLYQIRKGHIAEQAVREAKKLNRAHIQFNTILMYGIAGKGKGVANALASAEMVNQFKSQKLVTMNYTVFEFSKMAKEVREGSFVQESAAEKLEELRTLLEHLSADAVEEIDTTHPTNLFKMRGSLPEVLNTLYTKYGK